MTDGEKTFDQLMAEVNREINSHRQERDNLQTQSKVWAEKRDALNAKAREKSSQAAIFRDQRDEFNRCAREARDERDRWNTAAAESRGSLGGSSEARSQANNHHQKVVHFSASGQAAHEKMTQLYEEADKLREQANDAHAKCTICRKVADSEHQKYLEAVKRAQRIRDGLFDEF